MVGWTMMNLLLLILSYKVSTSLDGPLRMFRTMKDKTNIRNKSLTCKRSTISENECNLSLINCMNKNKDFLRDSDFYLFFMYKKGSFYQTNSLFSSTLRKTPN